MFGLLLGNLLVLSPLGIYFLILARLNRGGNAVIVSGPWDFAGVLFALSGLFLYVGPGFLTGFSFRWRDVWLQLHYDNLRGGHDRMALVWLLVWYLYFGSLVAGAGWMLWRRRLVTALYNVDAEALNSVLGQTFDRLGFSWSRFANRFIIRPGLVESAANPADLPYAPLGGFLPEDAPAQHGSPLREDDSYSKGLSPDALLLEVDAFLAMRHVTLNWPTNAGPIRREIEAELTRRLPEIRTWHNPAGNWFQWLAAGMFMLTFVLTLLLQALITRAQNF